MQLNILAAAFLAGFLLYILIPGGGAFWVRRRWRLFRKGVLSATLMPELTYSGIRRAGDGYLGDYRITGSLQAIQGNDTVWVIGSGLTVRVNLSGVEVYTLPHTVLSGSGNTILTLQESLNDDVPSRITWDRIFSLPEGTRLLIAGSLYRENGQVCFRSSRNRPLLVLLYDGKEDSILLRSVWAGRHRNEYLNDFTPGSLIAGCLTLLLLTYLSFRQERSSLTGWLIMSMAFIPLLIYLPPGVVLFELYRSFWGKGRRLRAERDLFGLPLRYWPDAVSLEDCADLELPGGGVYGYQWFSSEMLAMEAVPGGQFIRAGRWSGSDGRCIVFGIKAGNGGPQTWPVFTASRDLLIPPLIFQGDPFPFRRHCMSGARRMELLSGLFFLAGLAGNLLILYLLLRYWVF